jgi:NhaP-type Na+/H+ or K+/H+ antiporter
MFSAVYLMGFIGTGGREAGSELVLAVGVTLGGVLVGLLVSKLGGWVASYDSRFEA